MLGTLRIKEQPGGQPSRHDDIQPAQPGARSAERAVRPRDAQAMLSVELLEQLRLLNNNFSAFAAQTRGGIANGVLEVAAWTFDSVSGQVVRTYNTQVGSIVVANATGASVTVQAGTSPASSAPSSGRGIQVVPNGTWLAIPIGSHSFTMWGTAGTTVSLQVYADMQAIGATR